MINIEDLKQFESERYARLLVLKTDNVEMILVCWKPGQGTAVHGHGPSDGIATILEGEIEEVVYYPDGKCVTNHYKANDILHTPVGLQHEMRNVSDKNAVSLHVYAPPLQREFMKADLGYTNDVEVTEIQLPEKCVSFLSGKPCSKPIQK